MGGSVMRTLAADRYSPVTDSFGFFEAPIDEVAAAFQAWYEEIPELLAQDPVHGVPGHALHGDLPLVPVIFSPAEERLRRAHEKEVPPGPVTIRPLRAPFPEVLRNLEPLTVGTSERRLLLSTDSRWTALFDNGAPFPDPWGPLHVVAERLGCRSIGVSCATMPTLLGRLLRRPRLMPADVRFELEGPEAKDIYPGFRNYHIRTVQLAWDGRLVFVTAGDQQPFEEPAAYAARRMRKRFTSDMLERYAAAFDIRLFDLDFYGPDGILIERISVPPLARLTIEEARRRLWEP
ncbi:MAG: hypothetical protein KF809_14065 [Chloroflexi bacterium]|nr:hypothetical protein [Chloroflexota bacterium]